MAVIIGSARIDENGKATGGKAGDQTGKELSTQNWYKHSKGWRVFRAKDPAAAEKIAAAMQAACDNPNIGYDQNERNDLYSVSKLVGFNPGAVKSKVETDCSALVRVCCAYAGIMLPNFYTGDQPKTMLDSGKFDELTGSKYQNSSDYLKRGDVLVTKTKGHTVVVLSDGPLAGATSGQVGKFAVKVIDGSWHVRTAPDKNSKSLGIVSAGQTFPYLDETDNGWDKIMYNDQVAYISVRACELVPEATLRHIEIKGSWYVRTAPNKEADSIGIVHTGDVVRYQGETKDGWYLVEYKNTNAWISTKAGSIV